MTERAKREGEAPAEPGRAAPGSDYASCATAVSAVLPLEALGTLGTADTAVAHGDCEWLARREPALPNLTSTADPR